MHLPGTWNWVLAALARMVPRIETEGDTKASGRADRGSRLSSRDLLARRRAFDRMRSELSSTTQAEELRVNDANPTLSGTRRRPAL